MDTYLLDETWIKTYTPINEFVDIKQIRPFFKLSHEIFIKDIVGEQLYNRLIQSQIDNDATADELVLIDYIKPALAYDITARCIVFTATQIRAAGVVRPTDDKFQPATRQEVLDLETRVQNYCDYYTERLNVYLCDNGSKFPLLRQQGNPNADTSSRYGVTDGLGSYFPCGCSGECNCWG